MSTAIRNFFITFVLALLIFGGLAYYFYGELEALLPINGQGVESETSDESGDHVSETSSSGGVVILPPDKEGEELGDLNGLIVTKNADGEVMRALFMRFHSSKRRIVTCELSLSVSVYNEVGSLVPLRDFLRLYDGKEASVAINALTGFTADFYLEITPDSLQSMVANMKDPQYFVKQEVRMRNPVYSGVEFQPWENKPSDYELVVPAGRVTLTAESLSVLLGHYAACDGSDGHEDYSRLLSGLYETLLQQMSNGQRETMTADYDRLARVYAGCDTNLTAEFLRQHGTLLYRYGGDKAYEVRTIPYTTRDATLHAIKAADLD